MVKWGRFVARDFDLDGDERGGANWLRPGPILKRETFYGNEIVAKNNRESCYGKMT